MAKFNDPSYVQVTPSNPFALVDSSVLDHLRRVELKGTLRDERSRLSGQSYAAAVAGTLMGDAIGNFLTDKGYRQDSERTEAAAVTSAEKKARLNVQSTPPEMRDTDPYAEQEQYGTELVRELTAAGLHDQADSVRNRMLGLRQQKLELDKLDGAVEGQGLSNLRSRLDYVTEAATQDAKIAKTRADAVNSTVTANLAVNGEQYNLQLPRVELDAKMEALRHSKVLAPFVEQKAEDDLAIADMQATMGGPVPQLVLLQNQRDNLLGAIAETPGGDHKWSLKTVEEINDRINTLRFGIVHNVPGAFDPTNSVKSEIQTGLKDMADFQVQIDQILKGLSNSTSDSFGVDADLRLKTAGGLTKVMGLLALPQSVIDATGNAIVSDNALSTRALARQLHADMTSWFSKSRSVTPEAAKVADNMLQALDDPLVTNRNVANSLTHLTEWIIQHQTTGYTILDQNIKAVVPEAAQSLEAQYNAQFHGAQ